LPEIAAGECGCVVAVHAVQDDSTLDHVDVVPVLASLHEEEPRATRELDLADAAPDAEPVELEPQTADPYADWIALILPQAPVGGALQLLDRIHPQEDGGEVVADEEQGTAAVGSRHDSIRAADRRCEQGALVRPPDSGPAAVAGASRRSEEDHLMRAALNVHERSLIDGTDDLILPAPVAEPLVTCVLDLPLRQRALGELAEEGSVHLHHPVVVRGVHA